jgi:hypothetical protein
MISRRISFSILAFLILSLLVWISIQPDPRDPVHSVDGEIQTGETLALQESTVASESSRERGQRYLRIRAGTPFRRNPGLGGSAESRASRDEMVPVVARRGDWAQVRTTEEGGKTRLVWVAYDEDAEVVILGGAREANSPDLEMTGLGRSLMGSDARTGRCGPYELISDAREDWLVDTCERLIPALEGTFVDRFGIVPLGDPKEAILFFDDAGDFRNFVRRSDLGRIGNLAHAVPSSGFLALYAGRQDRAKLLRTFLHELTHLVSYRAFGPNLPRWLSEGLADAIGDTASGEAIQALEGIGGSEDEARRLGRAYDDGQAGDLARLLALDEATFDSGVVSFDYEQSALFVRYLLSEESMATGFRSFLAELSLGRLYAPDLLLSHLGTTLPELDRGFQSWIDQRLSRLD